MLNEELLQPNQEPLATDEDLGDIAWSATAETEAAEPESGLDPESLFAADLAATTLLTRAEEEVLARKITRARARVRAIARKARRLSRAALAGGGRGVVAPEQNFRERETLVILNYARQALRDPRVARTTGMGRRELRAFVSQLSTALDNYRQLRDQMVRANVRLVSVLARRYRHPTLTYLDLFQEGTVGLLRAVEKFDPSRNIKFSTYATWWIWQQLGRAADTQGSLIRTPVHWNQFRRRMSRDARELAADNEGPVSRADLASKAGMDRAQLDTMAQAFQFVSTDAPVSDEDDRTLETMLAADAVEPEEHALKSGLRERLDAALQQLPPRESMILRQRFGLQDDESETLEQIGSRLGVSRERIRQLENRALKHLKQVCTAQGLHEYLH
jgi:RNA polymerase sigma factor (sigma-70 family)